MENTEESLRTQAYSIAKMLSGYAWDEKDLPQSAFFFIENVEQGGHYIFKIYDNHGTLIASSNEDDNFVINEKALKAIEGEEVKWIKEENGEKNIHITVPVSTWDKVIGIVDVSTSLSEIENIFSMMIRILGIATVFSVIIVSIIGFIIARTVTKPLNKIKNIAGKISQGNFTERAEPVKNPAELSELANTINYMAEQLKSFIGEITEEKNKINAILTNVIDGLIAIDQEGKIIFLNLTAEKKLKVNNHEVTGKFLKDIWQEEEIICHTKKAIKKKNLLRKEITISNEPLEILDFTFAPFEDEKKENQGIMIVFRDVTELRRLEKVRSEFLSNVSHELRTPLTIIKGFCITLLDDPGEKEEWSHALNTIEQETDRLTRLVNEMLELSRLRNKKISLRIEKNNIRDLLLQVINQFKDQCKKYNIKLSYSMSEELPEINFDRDKIKQVFINLIANAFKYTPPSGEVKIETYFLRKDNLFNIKVSDTGPGIPEEEIPHLFERYFRSEKNKSRIGTGLGLPIVKEIIDAHEGEIVIKNKKPHGLEVNIILNSK